MKVEHGRVFREANGQRNPATTADRSFAEILTKGRSIESIRSERAIGFDETGIFGASRTTKAPHPVPQSFRQQAASAANLMQPQTAKSQREIPSKPDVIIQRVLRLNTAPNALPPPVAIRGSIMRPSIAALPSTFLVSIVNCSGLVAAPLEKRRAKMEPKSRHKPTVFLNEDDNGIQVIVTGNLSNDLICEELVANLFLVASQFNVTLKAVTLNIAQTNKT